MGVTLVKGKQHNVVKRDGRIEPFSWDKLNKVLKWAAAHKTEIPENMIDFMIKEIKNNMNLRIFDKIKIEKLFDETIDVAANLADRMYPEYDLIARNLFIQKIYKETWEIKRDEYPDYKDVIKKGLQYGVYGEAFESLNDEDIEELGNFIDSAYDFKFNSFLGISTFFNKYCKKYSKTKKLELPQHAMMRIAIQAFYNEPKNQRIALMKRFYDIIKNHLISRATPYYINAGGPKPMLSSCVLVAAGDDSYSINKACNNIGMYSREGGGTALDVSPIRSIDAIVDKTGRSSGKVPFIKMVESVISAYNQKSARPGACAVYFNWWDYEVMDLLMLKDEGGSEERRARKLQYAIKLNDVFIEALLADKDVYLFDPKDAPELLEAHSDEFTMKYFECAQKTGIRKKKIKARELGYLIAKIRNETGNLYIFFDDNVNGNTPFNEKIRQSNLCFTGDTVVAVADGRNGVTIEQLANESQGKIKFPVYCSFPRKNKVKGRRGCGKTIMTGWDSPHIEWAVAYKTGRKKVIEVILEDGSSFKCTEDHELATIDGGYVEAKDSKGIELEPFFTYTPSYGSKYRHINSISNADSRQHIKIWKFFNGSIKKSQEIDHIDDTIKYKRDSINNLQIMSKIEHRNKTRESRMKEKNPIHRINDRNKWKESIKTKTIGANNGNSGGITNEELILLGRIIHKMYPGEFTKNKYLLLKYIHGFDVPEFFSSKYRFNKSFDEYKKYVEDETLVYTEPQNTKKIRQKEFRIDKIIESVDKERLDFIRNQFYIIDDKNIIRKGIKVVDIIEHGEEDVYDLTVDNAHNFYIITSTEDDNYENCHGVLVHNCTEITLPTKPTLKQETNVVQEWNKDKPHIETEDYGEIALCNLSAINAVEWAKLDEKDKQELTYLLARAFDNEVESMYYAAREGEIANKLYRSIGIGVNGLAAYFAFNKVKFTDPQSFKLEFDLFEDIYYHVYSASVAIAKERSPFPRFKQTKWADRWLPIDFFKKEFDKYAEDWQAERWKQLREDIMRYGIRFATTGSIMPGATSSMFLKNATESTEPVKQLVATKTGTYTCKQFVPQIRKYGMYYQIAWEVPNSILLKHAQIRQMFLDQAQSINTYSDNPQSAFETMRTIVEASKLGIKTLYYLNMQKGEVHEACENCSS